jgi:hypothetical protein
MRLLHKAISWRYDNRTATFSITTLGIRSFYDIEHKWLSACITFSITMLCYYAECCILFAIMLNVVMLSVVVPISRQ